MATDPDTSSKYVAGLRFLLGEAPDLDTFAQACHDVLGVRVYRLLHALEERGDTVMPITIDVDDVLEQVDEDDDIQWSEVVAAMDEPTRKKHIRALMNDIMDWDHVSKRKFEIQDDFIEYLKDEDIGAVVDAPPKDAEEADAAAT